MTGYYEPELKAYRFQEAGRYPIYKDPQKHNLKYLSRLSRKEINTGKLDGKGLEIAWVENEIEAFFLQIQGSGRLKFSDEEIIKIRYAGNNGKSYTSIGKILKEKKKLNKNNINMYSIKEWLHKNPKLAKKIMEENERYIFFEEYEGNIKGSGLEDLLPNVSVAVDADYIKIGTPIIIKDKSTKNNIFLAIAHDKGNAIKGEFRIDLFTGFGKRAEKKAAMLKKNIEVYPLHLRKF